MASGLDGVIAADTVLSHTDQTNGMVWVRARDLPTLVGQHGFEGTIALLWDGFAGDGLTRAAITSAFGQARLSAYRALPSWLPETAGRSLFEGMRIALAAQPDSADAVALVGALAVAVPALARQASGSSPVAPDPALSTAADLLRMLHESQAERAHAAALDTYLPSWPKVA